MNFGTEELTNVMLPNSLGDQFVLRNVSWE